MMNTLPKESAGWQVVKRLLLVAALAYGFHHRAEISHGVSDFLAKNQLAQNTKESIKWLVELMRPQTEAEKRQTEDFFERQRQEIKGLKASGIENPTMKYVTKDDPEWEQAKAGMQEFKQKYGSR